MLIYRITLELVKYSVEFLYSYQYQACVNAEKYPIFKRLQLLHKTNFFKIPKNLIIIWEDILPGHFSPFFLLDAHFLELYTNYEI
jgi:hypothetical protein